MKPRFFTSAAEFRRWLAKHHATASELWVGFYRKDSGRSGITYKEAVDEALCFGWIDGIKKRVDDHGYTHRFTPRQATSTWSAINIKRVKELIGLGRIAPAGQRAFDERDPRKVQLYSFENRPAVFDKTIERAFKAHLAAWAFFRGQPPGYQRLMTFWIMSAKKDETRLRRLDALVKKSAEGKRLQ
jgi:uncharacterized protein YdeI (YjbR/CyaY-like superfamily)